jgi:hypothetical protein
MAGVFKAKDASKYSRSLISKDFTVKHAHQSADRVRRLVVELIV